MDQQGLHIECPRDLFQPVKVAVCHISDLSFFLFGMLDSSYTRRGLLCEGLSSQSVDRGCVLVGSTLDDRASHDTILQFSSVVT